MTILDPIKGVVNPAISALYEITNPILILLIVLLFLGLVVLGHVIRKMYISSKAELKEKDKQLDEVYATMHKDSKISLEFMLTLEKKFNEYIKISQEVGSDVKDLIVIVSILKTQIEFMIKR